MTSRRPSQFVKDVSYTFLANVVSSLVSALSVILLPKFMGVADYGYWQLYLLFTLYISFMHLGIADGYYLRYSGIDPKDQDRAMFASLMVFVLALVVVFIIALGLLLAYGPLFSDNPEKRFVAAATLACAFLVTLRVFIQFGWQAVRMFKQNAQIIIIERVLFIVAAIVVLLSGHPNFKALIYFDLGVKFVALLVALYMARELLFSGMAPLRATLAEAWANISAGIKIMLATTISSLVIGSIQFVIQGRWSIETYSKVGLTLTLSNLVMVFINAVALALLPQVRRLEKEHEKLVYASLLTLVSVVIVVVLNAYYPLVVVVGLWLPAYEDSLHYMAILFPLCLFECKTALVTNTYLKALRKEQTLLAINVMTLVVGFAMAALSAFWLGNLELTVVCILVSLAIRSLVSEYLVSSVYGLPFAASCLRQCVIAIGFVGAHWFVGGWPGALVFAALSVAFVLVEGKNVRGAWAALGEHVVKDR